MLNTLLVSLVTSAIFMALILNIVKFFRKIISCKEDSVFPDPPLIVIKSTRRSLDSSKESTMSRSQNKENDIVLSYHDCVLRQADIRLLNGPFWLNDAIIGFYFEYLGQKYQGSKLLFISPELTQLLKLTSPPDYSIFLDPIKAKDKDVIFFPVNDCNSRSSAGGTHWSLMVFSKLERTCFYFDSSNGINASVASDFSRDIISYLIERGTGQFVEVNCPQQENGYDCGLFVLCFADIIAEHILKMSEIECCNCDRVKSLVYAKRKSLLTLIDELKSFKH